MVVERFFVGDHVAIAGVGYANYAEVPTNLIARKPSQISFQEASSDALG